MISGRARGCNTWHSTDSINRGSCGKDVGHAVEFQFVLHAVPLKSFPSIEEISVTNKMDIWYRWCCSAISFTAEHYLCFSKKSSTDGVESLVSSPSPST